MHDQHPSAALLKQAIACGNVSGRSVDKFRSFGLTAVPSLMVGPPIIDECYANLECRVTDTRMVNKYCFFVLEVAKAWIRGAVTDPDAIHHLGRGVFKVSGKIVRTRSRARL